MFILFFCIQSIKFLLFLLFEHLLPASVAIVRFPFPHQNILKPVLHDLCLVACIFVFEAVKYMYVYTVIMDGVLA